MASLETNVRQTNADFQAIKNKIVEKGIDIPEGTRTAEYASKIDSVHQKGKDAEYDRFWNAYQDHGNRTNYQYGGFGGEGWVDEIYNPKYPLRPIQSYRMYISCKLTRVLNLDTSLSKNMSQLFYVCYSLEHVGTISTESLPETGSGSAIDSMFGYCQKLKTIDKLILKPSVSYSNTFFQCYALENITIEGIIGQSGLNLQYSTELTKASITSIINALSTTTGGLTVTLSKTAVNNAFETSSGIANGSTSEEWLNLIATRSNWTISLI